MIKQISRRLTTIFAADVAEYSRLVSENESSALEQLAKLRAMMDPVIERYDGKIANTAGDSVIASFDGPVDAVQAALEIQSAQEKHNEQVPKEKRVLVRIGINIGDVAVQLNGDLLGHGVNIAARLESLADSGGICLAENVVEQVRNHVDFEFSKIGEHFVKNIEKPISVYSTGKSGRRKIERASRFMHARIRSPAFQFGMFASVTVALSLSIWLSISDSNPLDKSGWDIESVLNSSPTPQELLESFDLVSEGEFGGSQYYVIRTWGGKLEHLQRIAENLGGHLVAIGSEEENEFVFNLTLADEGHWAFLGNLAIGPMIGLIQDSAAKEPDFGWAWSNGEPLVYTNWKRYSPDNSGGNQDFANFQGRQTNLPSPNWNDVKSVSQSFVVEVPSKPSN